MNVAEMQQRITTLEQTLRRVDAELLASRQRLLLVRQLIQEPRRFERAPGIMVGNLRLALESQPPTVAAMLREERQRAAGEGGWHTAAHG
ncbi:hypothetical protein [Micromonospora sp. NBC_01796]|uniref:hypothetical protein n=1 Tax=Micromonospora sp. NBC_01796 TaxID=2975987 RepID=UPI002DD8A2E5|nr:hypothetical protein [Micromonospora sp. NBC_01796]WSA85543.1 hypothetical protein OIE47_35210 [Micromonospora sp. NBC_01796]